MNISKALSDDIKNQNFETTSDAARYILANINKSYTIFLKASLSEKFEDIIKILEGDNL